MAAFLLALLLSTYMVQPGDTLTAISRQSGVPVAILVEQNGIPDPDLIYPGQVLTLDWDAARPPPEDGSRGELVAEVARRYLGAAYVWGGLSPEVGFDCAGLVRWVYREALSVELTTYIPGLLAGWPDAGEPMPGDVLVFANLKRPGPSHVGIYEGEGWFIHAAGEEWGVRRDLLDDYRGYLVGVLRLWAESS